MTLTITSTTMTGARTPHTARKAPGRTGWEVSWLPGQTLDANAAVTAMTIANLVGTADLQEGHRLWPHIQGWAAELGLTASRPPGDIVRHPDQAAERPDPEAGD